MLSSKLPWELANPKWAQELNPIIANPATNMTILKNVLLAVGNNQIAHLLGRMQQGWTILDINAASSIYRYKAFTDTYLYLNASAIATVNIGVF